MLFKQKYLLCRLEWKAWCIILICLLGHVGCRGWRSKIARTSAREVPIRQQEGGASLKVKILRRKTGSLHNERKVKIVIDGLGRQGNCQLENLRLQVEILGNEALKGLIRYTDAGGKLHEVNRFQGPLDNLISSFFKHSSRKHAIDLVIDMQYVSELKLAISLLDNNEQILDYKEEVIRCGKLLVNEVEGSAGWVGDAMGYFTLQNATDAPIDLNAVKLKLTTYHEGLMCHFVKSNDGQAILQDLLVDQHVNKQLMPGDRTDRIALRMVGCVKERQPVSVSLNIKEIGKRTAGYEHVLCWISEAGGMPVGVCKQENLPKLCLTVKEQVGKKVRFLLVNQGGTLDKVAMRKMRLYYKIASTPGNVSNAYMKRVSSRVSVPDGICLGDLVGHHFPQGAHKGFELIIANEQLQRLTIKFALTGMQAADAVVVQWEK